MLTSIIFVDMNKFRYKSILSTCYTGIKLNPRSVLTQIVAEHGGNETV